MVQTLEAATDEQGKVCFIQPVKPDPGVQLLVTVLNKPQINVSETALLSEQALAEDWNRPEEDEAWSHLQLDRLS
jgi:hypothetical protein